MQAYDETISKSHKSFGLAIANRPLPDSLPDGTVLTYIQMRELRGELSEEPRSKAELDKVFNAMSAAKSTVEQGLQNVIWEKHTLKAKCEQGKKLLDHTLKNLRERTTDFWALGNERDATLGALKEK